MIVTVILRGGLGNCLFGICTTLAYSIKHGCDFCIPTIIDNPHYEGQKVFYSKYLKYCDSIEGIKKGDDVWYMPNTIYTEPFFHYTEIPKFSVFSLKLDGYFQSWKYFHEYRKEILKILDIPYELKNNTCAICIRRGDYLNLTDYHNVVSNIYLQEAQIKIMNKNVGKFEVYSDDIYWCKKYMPQFDDADYYFSEGKTDIEDLSLASSCQHVIMSASSFSWWVAWLGRNNDRQVISPAKWFGKKLDHNTKDLYLPNSIII